MGLRIRRVTQIKSKLLFASLAIMAIAVQPMYGFVASQVANAAGDATYYVDQASGTDDDDCGQASGTDACATIQEAIDKAEAGNTINVATGDYSSIKIDKPLTIVGAGKGSTTIKGQGSGYGIDISGSVEDGVTIQNLQVTNFNHGLEVHGSNGNPTKIKNITLKKASFSGNNVGFKVDTNSSVNGLVVRSSDFNNNNEGWHFAGTDGNSVVDGVNVKGTIFDSNSANAIYAEKLSNATFNRNEFNGKDKNATKPTGINLNGVSGKVSSIKIKNSSFTQFNRAFKVNGGNLSNFTIKKNHFVGNNSALIFDKTDNTKLELIKINNNDIYSNSHEGVYNNTGDGMDITKNWWGKPTGISGHDIHPRQNRIDSDWKPWLCAPFEQTDQTSVNGDCQTTFEDVQLQNGSLAEFNKDRQKSQNIDSDKMVDTGHATATDFYDVRDSLDLSATLGDFNGLKSAEYRVVRTTAKGNLMSNPNHNYASGEGYKSAWYKLNNTDDEWTTPESNRFDTNSVNDGTYVVLLKATDDSDNEVTKNIYITVDNTAPTITLGSLSVMGDHFTSANLNDSNDGNLKLTIKTSELLKKGYAKLIRSDAEQPDYHYEKDMSANYKLKLQSSDGGEYKYVANIDLNDDLLKGKTSDNLLVDIYTVDEAGNHRFWIYNGTPSEYKDAASMYFFTVDNTTDTTEKPGDKVDSDNTGDSNKKTGENINGNTPDEASPIDLDLDQTTGPGGQSPNPNSIFNRNLAFNPTTDGDDETEDVLSASTFNQPAQTEVKGAADDKSSPASFFGLAWYWWVLIVAALLAAIGWIAAAARKKQDA